MAYACGGEPFSKVGCDRYFCSKHKEMVGFNPDNTVCQHEQDIDGRCDCDWKDVCERCAKDEQPFNYKPEHPEWIHHLLTDESWAKWRRENPEEVAELDVARIISAKDEAKPRKVV
jgi:hypothetical protein